MIGAVVGDVIGSYFEHFPTKYTDFDLFSENSFFTDDTVLTVAVADWLLDGGELASCFHRYVAWYPGAGYGASFLNWARCGETEPYGSWGNGSAMRVSPVAYVAETLSDALTLAEKSAAVTHNHPTGILGAVAIAGCVFMALQGGSKEDIRRFVVNEIGYDLSRTTDQIRPHYGFDVSCSGSVPEAITAFLESNSVEHAIRLAISLGGDADTLACMAGAIGEAFFGNVPSELWVETKRRLDDRLIGVIEKFQARFVI